MLFVFLIVTVVCLFIALKRKKPFLLVVPFLSIFVYFVVQVALVPAPFFETVKFILSLS